MRSRSFLGRWRGENILKEAIACAKALRFESSSNEENASFAMHAEPKLAVLWNVYHGVSSGLKTKALLVSLLHGSGS